MVGQNGDAEYFNDYQCVYSKCVYILSMLQVAILARSSREMSLTVRILSRVRISVRPSRARR